MPFGFSWSFGVLLFELFSLGDVPFPCHQPADMLEHLETGNRLKQPSFCPNEMQVGVLRSPFGGSLSSALKRKIFICTVPNFQYAGVHLRIKF
jgi:hypothetical protein